MSRIMWIEGAHRTGKSMAALGGAMLAAANCSHAPPNRVLYICVGTRVEEKLARAEMLSRDTLALAKLMFRPVTLGLTVPKLEASVDAEDLHTLVIDGVDDLSATGTHPNAWSEWLTVCQQLTEMAERVRYQVWCTTTRARPPGI